MGHTQVTNIIEVVKSHWKLKCATLIYPEILSWKLPQFLSYIPRVSSEFRVQLAYNGTRAFQDKFLSVQKKVAQLTNLKKREICNISGHVIYVILYTKIWYI